MRGGKLKVAFGATVQREWCNESGESTTVMKANQGMGDDAMGHIYKHASILLHRLGRMERRAVVTILLGYGNGRR